MNNPWEKILLSDYESHMSLDTVMQLQELKNMMKSQFESYDTNSLMILGIAGGNGLEHISKEKFNKVYGVDINEEYLKVVKERYGDIDGVLECLKVDLINEAYKLPHVQFIIANLLVEYIGYVCFKEVIKQVNPKYVSCIIQINKSDAWVSESPYIHAFDSLEVVHNEMREDELICHMKEIGYKSIERVENELPNGKSLLRLDFVI